MSVSVVVVVPVSVSVSARRVDLLLLLLAADEFGIEVFFDFVECASVLWGGGWVEATQR